MMNAEKHKRAPNGQALAVAQPVREGETSGRKIEDRDLCQKLSHELRHPLASILNGIALLRQEGEDAQTREWLAGLLERQTHRLGRVIDDLLDISRVAHGKLPINKRRVVLGECVARAVETVSPEIEGHGHRLEVALPREPVFLQADPFRLEQVLINFLTNAAKYTDPGGHIWLTAEHDGRSRLRERCARHEASASRPRNCCRMSSIFSGNPSAPATTRKGGWGSAWPWYGSWWNCTVAA